MEETRKLISLKDFISGGAAGVVQVILGQPLDIVKVRMQTSSVQNSSLEIAKNIYKNEGALGFYSGTTSPLIGVSFCIAILFGSNEIAKRHFKKKHGTLTIKDSIFSGMFAGLCGSFLASPIELFRIKMQVQGANGSKPVYSSTIDCLKKVLTQHGLKGVYQGLYATMIRDVIAGGVYFGVYETLMRRSEAVHGDRKKIPMILITLYGAFAGICLWASTFPMDVIKSRIQAENLENTRYTSIIKTMQHIKSETGIGGFFKGLSPCLVRAAPINAASFLTFELLQKLQS